MAIDKGKKKPHAYWKEGQLINIRAIDGVTRVLTKLGSQMPLYA